MDNQNNKVIKPYTFEWIKANRSKSIRSAIKTIAIILFLIFLFTTDGKSVYQNTLSRANILTQSEARELIDQMEKHYFGQYVLDYKVHEVNKEQFLKASYMTYYDFYDYISVVAEMANDYYSSFIFNTPEVNYYDAYIARLETSSQNTETIELGGRRVGYIEVQSLNPQVNEDIKNALESYKAEGVNALIIDLTSSPLGDVESTLVFLDLFISDQELMRYAHYNGYSQIFQAQIGVYNFDKIFVLINEEVNGPGEIIALSLKTNLKKRVQLLGQPPYLVPYLFEYQINKAHHYILKYAVGKWQIGDVKPELSAYEMDLNQDVYNQEKVLTWIGEQLK